MPLSLSPSLLMSSASSVAFSPLSLFASGEQGAWYDPSDLSTMFQDTAGTTPVTATGQTVARINDKSGRGNHATQATAASRPIYGIEPFGGRRNLLVRTEEFDNAVWVKNNVTVTADAAPAPDGTTTADGIFETTFNNFHATCPNATVIAAANGQTYTASFYAKANGRTKGYVSVVNGGGFATFDLGAKTIVFGGNGTNETVTAQTITELSNGWFRLTITSSFTGFASVRPTFGINNDAGAASYAGDPTKGYFIWGAQLEVGSTATAYQRVTDQWNVTQAGVPSVSYIQFDGTDDFLLTGTITPGTDKAQVFAGVRKLSDAAAGVLLELSTQFDVNNGTLSAVAPGGTAGSFSYRFNSRGTSTASAGSSAFAPAPNTSVITGLGDISGDTATLRRNGALVETSTTDQGTGNYLTYPLYIGRRGGTTLPFNGRIYGLAVRFGANLSAAQISQMETWLNARTGAY